MPNSSNHSSEQEEENIAQQGNTLSALDDEIVELEKTHADQFAIEAKKKEKLKLKDEIYAVLIKHKN